MGNYEFNRIINGPSALQQYRGMAVCVREDRHVIICIFIFAYPLSMPLNFLHAFAGVLSSLHHGCPGYRESAGARLNRGYIRNNAGENIAGS